MKKRFIFFTFLFLLSSIVKAQFFGGTNTPPFLITTLAQSITATTATSGGSIITGGSSAIRARGVCWSTSQNPTTANSKTTDAGTTVGTYTSSLTGLTANTTYYVRAYATNTQGTSYGTQISFITAPPPPTVGATIAATNITGSSATSGGNITSTSALLMARGVCWSTSQNPTTENSKTNEGGQTGTFTSSLTGLSAGTTYYIRAYATNAVGTAYGAELSFTTLSTPTVAATVAATAAATSITATTAISGGNITNDGGSTITARGVCWSTSQNPTTANSKTIDLGTTGSYTSSITGLTIGTTYYVRAYATNAVATAYGPQINFTTRTLLIGDTYGGGKVAYILQSGDPGYDANVPHGLIAAIGDQGLARFGCAGTFISGADRTAIGTGNQNTINIMNGCSTADIAARICGDLVLNGYSDWYLPSKDELNKLFLNKTAIGGFAVNYYWSSTETDNYSAWAQSFNYGNQLNSTKNDTNYVRAVRAF